MDGLVARAPKRAIIDEVRRVPELSLPLKVEVDRRRTPGRFLLTGSANVLLLPRVADSLSGRMGSIRLHPMEHDRGQASKSLNRAQTCGESRSKCPGCIEFRSLRYETSVLGDPACPAISPPSAIALPGRKRMPVRDLPAICPRSAHRPRSAREVDA